MGTGYPFDVTWEVPERVRDGEGTKVSTSCRRGSGQNTGRRHGGVVGCRGVCGGKGGI